MLLATTDWQPLYSLEDTDLKEVEALKLANAYKRTGAVRFSTTIPVISAPCYVRFLISRQGQDTVIDYDVLTTEQINHFHSTITKSES